MAAIEKQRRIIGFTLSSLWRRRGRNLSLVAVYTFVIFLFAATMFFTHSMKKEASLGLREAPEMMVQRLVAGRQGYIPTSYTAPIKKIRGVQSVKPRLWSYYSEAASGANYTLMAAEELKDQAGRIIIGNRVARGIEAGQGGAMLFKTPGGPLLRLQIAGTLSSPSEHVNSDLIMMSEQDFRSLVAIPEGYATDLVLQVGNIRELATIAAKITQVYPDTRPILRDEILRTYEAVFDWRNGVIIVMLAGAFFAFVTLAWDKATGLSAEEQTEIGILKAIGWETSDILLMKFWEGTAVSISSFMLGAGLAYLNVLVGSWVLFDPVLRGWSVLYPGFRLTPYVNPYQLATLFSLTALPYTVATIIPSWRSAAVDPDSVMRM